MRTFFLILFSFASTSCCFMNGGRLHPPYGVWTYHDSSLLHGLGLEMDLFTDGTFQIRQAAGDQKTMSRTYQLLASGTYVVKEQSVEFTFSGPLPQPHNLPWLHSQNEPSTVMRGTISESGKKMTLDFFGEFLVFTWRSPS